MIYMYDIMIPLCNRKRTQVIYEIWLENSLKLLKNASIWIFSSPVCWKMCGYYKEKSLVNQFWQLKGEIIMDQHIFLVCNLTFSGNCVCLTFSRGDYWNKFWYLDHQCLMWFPSLLVTSLSCAWWNVALPLRCLLIRFY